MLLKYNTVKKSIKSTVLIALSLLLISCSSDKKATEEAIVKKKPTNPNVFERIKESDSGSGIFGSGKGKGTTYDFATSNVLWRATLKSLDFVPLTNASYSGGIVVTDWYSSNGTENESIKIQVKFLSDEIKSSSIEINSFKKKCQKNNFDSCKIIKLDSSFNNAIKDKILTNVRRISIEDSKNK